MEVRTVGTHGVVRVCRVRALPRVLANSIDGGFHIVNAHSVSVVLRSRQDEVGVGLNNK